MLFVKKTIYVKTNNVTQIQKPKKNFWFEIQG